MRYFIQLTLIMSLWCYATLAKAEIVVRITDGIDAALPVIVAPFEGTDAAKIIAADLKRSGRFTLVSSTRAGQPLRFQQPIRRELLQKSGADYVVVGKEQGGVLRVDLLSTANGQRVAGFQIPVHPHKRRMAHKAADLLFKQMIGIRGAFDTRLAYILATGRPGNQNFRLMISDADGYGARAVLSSRRPILSPTWSPNGRLLAYVSFEQDQASIYIQDLASGQKRKLLSYDGTSGAPAWSPDNRHLAISLTQNDNTDIYVINTRNGQVRRVTQSRAIDTEPAWASNHILIYTSDQTGQPQLYRTTLNGSDGKRFTFKGSYNSAASVVKNKVAMVRRQSGKFGIAIMNAASKASAFVSRAGSDESPSLAPNAAMVVYATRNNGREVIAVSSDNGKVRQIIPTPPGSARDPAWSPYQP